MPEGIATLFEPMWLHHSAIMEEAGDWSHVLQEITNMNKYEQISESLPFKAFLCINFWVNFQQVIRCLSDS